MKSRPMRMLETERFRLVPLTAADSTRLPAPTLYTSEPLLVTALVEAIDPESVPSPTCNVPAVIEVVPV